MPSLQTQKDFQGVRNLPFCYLCGRDFVATDAVDWDHVPAKSAFSPRDRDPPLKLETHRETCHAQWSDNDKKVGQLISLHEAQSYLYVSTGTGPYNTALDAIAIDEWWLLGQTEVMEMAKRGVPGVFTYGYYDGWVPN